MREGKGREKRNIRDKNEGDVRGGEEGQKGNKGRTEEKEGEKKRKES